MLVSPSRPFGARGCELEFEVSISASAPKSSPKKRIQTAKYAEYAEKRNTSAYFAYSAVLSPFYFGDVFESSKFCAVLSGSAGLRRGFAWRCSQFSARAKGKRPWLSAFGRWSPECLIMGAAKPTRSKKSNQTNSNLAVGE